MNRILVLLLLMAPLAACSPDTRKAAAQACVAKVRAQSPRSDGQSEEEYGDSLEPSIRECMKTAGFVFFSGQPECDDGAAANGLCYTTKKHW